MDFSRKEKQTITITWTAPRLFYIFPATRKNKRHTTITHHTHNQTHTHSQTHTIITSSKYISRKQSRPPQRHIQRQSSENAWLNTYRQIDLIDKQSTHDQSPFFVTILFFQNTSMRSRTAMSRTELSANSTMQMTVNILCIRIPREKQKP